MKHYTQLTQEQRYQIQVLMKAGLNQTEIAAIMGVQKFSISRELSRNRGLRGRHPKQADRLSLERRQAKAKPRINTKEWSLIERLLHEEWSPEQISLWLMA